MTDNNDFSSLTNVLMGPGSQPAGIDGAELDILQLPSGMDTYSAPILPEPEEVTHLSAALQRLDELLQFTEAWRAGQENIRVEVSDLDAANRELVDQVMGEGEVGILFGADGRTRIQESVLTGVWRVQQFAASGELLQDAIEVGPVPQLVMKDTFSAAAPSVSVSLQELPAGVCNAPPLLAEINEFLANYQPGDMPHTINLTLLPQSDEDLMFLDYCLGAGNTTILSRGYGNCRITSSATRNVWWVRYFNSQDKNILNSLELCTVPEAACAAPEDIADSAGRLREILEIYR